MYFEFIHCLDEADTAPYGRKDSCSLGFPDIWAKKGQIISKHKNLLGKVGHVKNQVKFEDKCGIK